jgi:fluoride exporter
MFIAVGGALGSVLRFIVQRVMIINFPNAFPTGTFLVNITGCFLIGVLFRLLSPQQSNTADLQLLLVTGFCGGFTTFSAFSLEGMMLLQQQRYSIFFVYFAASVTVGLAATIAGAWLAR